MRGKFDLQHDERGMTVVEVVAALALVSLVMLSLWEGYNLAERSRRQSEIQQTVATLADELLQAEGGMAANGAEQVRETACGAFKCTWQISAASDHGTEDVILVITEEATGKQWRFATVRRGSC